MSRCKAREVKPSVRVRECCSGQGGPFRVVCEDSHYVHQARDESRESTKITHAQAKIETVWPTARWVT